MTNLWWTTRDKGGTLRARWLGLFRRHVRLRMRRASRLPLPPVTLFSPQRLSLSNDNSLEFPISSAGNLSVKLVPSTNAENGSINLIGVSLNKEPTLRLPTPRRPEVDPQTFAELRPPLPEKDQVPLWKRLVYLLQPPTELLLAESGPLEWPGTLFPYQLEGIQALMSHEALLLADDMGLGKTIQTIAALRLLVLQRRVESALLCLRSRGLGDE